MTSAAEGNLTLMIEAVESGFHVDTRHPETSMTALMNAASGGHFACTVYLLGRGANLEQCDDAGKQAIHYACGAGQTELINELIKWSVDLHCPDRVGRTPLHFAYYGKHIDTAQILLDRGAGIDTKDRLGCSALHEVCIESKIEQYHKWRETCCRLCHSAKNCDVV